MEFAHAKEPRSMGHGQVKPKLDSCDGEPYIDTVEWFLPKVCVLLSLSFDDDANTE